MANLLVLLTTAILIPNSSIGVQAQLQECIGGGAGLHNYEQRSAVLCLVAACVDRVNSRTGKSDCPYVSRLCGDSKYSQVMRTQCPKTCGFCSVDGSTATPLYSGECRDLVNAATGKSDCGKRSQLCRNPIYKQLMSQQCPKTCGYC
ncbi:unnamed protein product [Haemonchus placei]|uniref:ShKT domain-containing protein n=1 Tax=Haemonchus placei TaxID=6290 RepID=A0A0N4WK06_HAEPC|nr:unnamed protein product [Haemonchus placei]